MLRYSSLNEMLLDNAAGKKGITLISANGDEEVVSYGNLYNDSLRILKFLTDNNIEKGSEIILFIDDNEKFIYTFWAAVLGGIIVVPITVGTNEVVKQKFINIYNLLNDPKIITSGKLKDQVVNILQPQNINLDEKILNFDDIDFSGELGVPANIDLDDIAFIQFSSGSTGDPKGVILTHRNLLTNMNAIVIGAKAKEEEVTISWMPLTHDMGLIGFHLTPMYANMDQIIIPPMAFIRNPLLYLEKAVEHKANILCSPNFGIKHILKLLEMKKDYILDLSNVRILFNGAEPISYDLCKKFIDKMKCHGLKENVIFPVYGMAEASLAVSFPDPDETIKCIHLDRTSIINGEKIKEITDVDDDSIAFVKLGRQVLNCEIMIANDENQALQEEVIGNIWIRGENVTKGYYKNSKATEGIRKAEGWIETGDLGFVKNGELVVTGRKKDIIFINGQNFYPHDIEFLINDLKKVGIKDCAVCGIPNEENQDEIVIFIATRLKECEFEALADEIKKVVSNKIGNEIKVVIPVKNIPKTTSGKTQRFKLEQDYKNGEFDKYIGKKAQITEKSIPLNDTEKVLKKLFEEALEIEDMPIDKNFFEMGGNSLKAVYLISKINEGFETDFELADIFNNLTIKHLVSTILPSENTDKVKITPTAEELYYPCLPTHEKLYLLNNLNTSEKMFNLLKIFEIDKNINKDKIIKALNKLLEIHPELKSSFTLVNNKLCCTYDKNKVFMVEEVSLEEDGLENYIEKFNCKFDLEKDILFKASLIDIGEKKLIAFCIHHIIVDGTSLGILLKDFIEIFNGKDIKSREISFKEYSTWKEKFNTTEKYKNQKRYWSDKFSEEIPVLNLPTDFKRPKELKYIGKSFNAQINDKIASKIKKFAINNSTTEYIVLMSIFNVLIYKYSSNNEFIIGSPVSCRGIKGAENIVGMLINTLPVKTVIGKEQSYMEYLKEFSGDILKDLANQYYYCDELVKDLNIKSSRNRNALYDVVFNMQNMELYNNSSLKEVYVESKTSKVDLTVDIMPIEKEYEINVEYSSELFKQVTMEKFIDRYIRLINIILDNPDLKINEVEIIDEDEKNKLLYQFNSTKSDVRLKSFKEQFEKQVNRTPNNTAIYFGAKTLTYKELNCKANCIAGYINKRKTVENDVVAIFMEPGLVRAATLVGTLKSGCGYIPIDKNYPAERINYILKDSNAGIVLSDNAISEEIEFDGDLVVLDDIDKIEDIAEDPANEINMSHIAYIIYTSGTTGKPKGVVAEQHNLSGYIKAFLNEFELNEADKFLQQASYGFDAFVEEMYPALTVGGSVSICTKDEVRDIKLLADKIKKQEISIISVSPLLLNEINKSEVIGNIHTFISGGDVLKWDYINNIVDKARVYNTYGPTETTVCATYYQCSMEDKNKKLPIGKPILNYTAYILDSEQKLCPVGIPGELCIGGIGVARGYMTNRDLTKEKFIVNPYIKDERIYRTGDLVRWLEDGNIDYIGRIDKQVNIRGYRIELDEIEGRLLGDKNIKEAVVIDRDDEQDEKYLIAYIVGEKEIDVNDLRKYLFKSLPEYMIPRYFVQLESIPVTTNGKVDRKALPIPSKNLLIGSEYEEPTNHIEKVLVDIWQEILQVDRVGINDNFFELGGHSLKLTVIASMVHKQLDTEVSIRDLFMLQSIKELALYIGTLDKTNYDEIKKVEERDFYDVSSAQKRMYMLQEFDLESTSYNISGAISIEGKLEKKKLEKVFNLLIKRHESLRTSFFKENDDIYQKIHDDINLSIEYIRGADANIHNIINSFVRPFNLEKAPLLRVGLIESSENQNILVYDVHHIIADGVSVGILVDEFAKLYNEMQLEDLSIQYKDFAYWQKHVTDSERYRAQESFWKNKFTTEDIPILNIPTDYSRPAIQSFQGKTMRYKIPSVINNELNNIIKETNCTKYMILLSAVNILLSKYSGQDDIIIGSPIAGRNNADLQNIIGMFVNTLAIRNYPKGSKRYIDFLMEVKKNSLEAYENQDYQFEELVDSLNLTRDMSRNPLFDVMFAMQNIENQQLKMEGLDIRRFTHDFNISKFDLSFTAEEVDGELYMEVEYCSNLFNEKTISRIIKSLDSVLGSITTNVNTKISDIDIISSEETKEILNGFNNTNVDYPKLETFHELFQKQVARTPNNIAVVFQEDSLTYAELNSKANRLARTLRENGVQRESIVGIMVEKSLEMIVGILAIIKAGGAYLPIDPNYPEDRVNYILSNSEANVVIAQKNTTNKFGDKCILIDIEDPDNYSAEDSDLPNINMPNDLIYVIYTSGTTGNPKGVMIEHRNLVNVMFSWIKHYALDSFEVKLLQLASMSFDVFAGDLCRSLFTGGTMYICPNDIKLDFDVLYKLINERKINIFESTPSFVIAFMDYIYENRLEIDSIKLLILGSDTCPIDQYKDLVKRYGHKMRVINSYGITEATIDSSYYEGDLEAVANLVNVPIGKPLNNTQMYILNSSLKLQPLGVYGELYIGGDSIARGYFKNDELTKQKFIDNPFIKDEKMYRTGDLARWLPDGNIEFLGRADYQVKIRGFRVEIKEIESILSNYNSIKQAIVIDKEDMNKTKYLCAYVVSSEEIVQQDIRRYLGEKLPEYMIPSYFVTLDKLPLTPNGKVDRKALPEPQSNVIIGNEYVAPTTSIEKKLQSIWQDVLGVDKIGIFDNFFELGGHSLKAISLASRINKGLDVVIPLKEIFKAPTISSLGKYIEHCEMSSYTTIESISRRDHYETSMAQKRMYILQQLDMESTGYNMSGLIEIKGHLDKEKLEESFKNLVLRHEALRTYFVIEDGEIVQKIKESIEFKVDIINEVYGDIDLKDLIKPFDLAKAPLMKVMLFEKKSDEFTMFFDIHHIICDGLSINLLINELAKFYNGEALEPLVIQYKDYAHWQNKVMDSKNFELQEQYWKGVFDDEIPVLNMPTDFIRPKIQRLEGDSIEFNVDRDLTWKVNDLSRSIETTPYTVLLSLVNILLAKYSGQNDIVVGSIVGGRNRIELENVMGVFINTLALRNKVDNNMTYESFVKSIKKNVVEAYENQDYPFEHLIEKLNINRDTSRNPLFDVMLSMEDDIDLEEIEAGEIVFKEIPFGRKVVNFDLRFIVTEIKEEIKFKIEYSTALFKKETIENLANHFLNILNQALNNPNVKLNEIKLIDSKEESIILEQFNNTFKEYPKNKTFVQLFEEQVERTPNKVAVIFKDTKLTYGEFNERANKLARRLRREGISRDSIVAIMTRRSLDMMVGIFGIIKAGGAYLPIDPYYPENRISYIINNSNANMILTESEFAAKANFEKPVLCLDNVDYSQEDGSNLPIINEPCDLLYVIYTSGSTGNPKGVMIEHRALINRIHWMQEFYPLKEEDVILQKTTYTFDVSVWEILWWSMVGAKVCLLESGKEKDVSEVVDNIYNNKITTIHFVPSMFNLFLQYVKESGKVNELKSLTRVFTSGEALQISQVADFNNEIATKLDTKLINLYGPTEAAIDVSYFNCGNTEFKSSVPIGKPINNINLYIISENGQLQPIGVTGELYIAGDGLARGYLNNHELTDKKFVENPYVKGTRMYKTGDLAKWLPDGNIEYLGRIDFQVKLRGFRIELEEIENNLLRYEGINEVVVITKKDDLGYEYLCAYYVAENLISPRELRSHLLECLPEYMVPSKFQRLDKMPLTSNGKLDRKALPEPAVEVGRDRVLDDAENDIQRKLIDIWKELLGVDNVGINDNFFELGGYSLKVTLMISKISKVFNVDIPFRVVFVSPTVKALADYIQSQDKTHREIIKVVDKKEFYPVSSAQKRMYLLQKFDENSTGYNMPEVMILEGAVDVEKLKQIFTTLVNRHDSLRTSFEVINEEIVQIVHDDLVLDMEYEENASKSADDIISTFIRPFNLISAPLFRVKLVKLEEAKYLLMLDMHHIISDGVSKSIIVEEFISLYNGTQLQEVKLQYKDYSSWINDIEGKDKISSQKKYWLEKLSGEIPVLELKTDYRRPLMQSFKGKKVKLKLTNNKVNKLRNLAKNNQSTMYMVFLSLINILLSKLTAQEDILVGTAVSGRTHPDLQKIVGMFVNTLVIRSSLNNNQRYSEFLEQIKENVLQAYENQEYQFEDLVEDLKIRRDISRNPLFDVMFTYLDDERTEMSLSNMTIKAYKEATNISKFDLNFSIEEFENEIEINLEYCEDLFKEETIIRFINQFDNIIESVLDNVEISISQINILGEEKNKVLYEFNNTDSIYDSKVTIQELFEKQVEKDPNAIAVVCGEKDITYKELNSKANMIAAILRNHGLQPNEVVPIMMNKSIEMVVGILGIIKAGCAYLPLDSSYPDKRLNYQLNDSSCQVLLVEEKLKVPEAFNGTVVSIPKLEAMEEIEENLEIVNSSEDLVYVIYTSGSTGQPKGVMIEHRNLLSLNNSLRKLVYDKFEEKVNIALLAPFVFDASVKQIFISLLNGHCLHLIVDKVKLNSVYLREYYNKNKIDVSDGTPIILDMLCNISDRNKSELGIKYFIIGGDALKPKAVTDFKNIYGNDISIINIYGPTECCVDSTAYFVDTELVDDYDNISIGKPLANEKIYILDKYMMPVPIGVPGEIYISGDGVARGYINKEALTNERFVENPFLKGKRMYKTGDLARWKYDGNIEFIGRVDSQVKIRGFRIELNEIERTILSNGKIKEAVVIDRIGKDSNRYLCAYFVCKGEIDSAELREYLGELLPDYMIPSYLIQLDKIPVSINGKYNIRELKDRKIETINLNEYVAPSTVTESLLIDIWMDILDVSRIGILDNFFEIGGNSLAALKVIARLQQNNYRMDMIDIFKNPTIKQLAKYINSSATTKLNSIKITDKENLVGKEVYKEIANELGVNEQTSYKEIQKDLVFDFSDISFDEFDNNVFRENVVKSYPVLPIQQFTLSYNTKIAVEINFDDVDNETFIENSIRDVIKTFSLLRSTINNEKLIAEWNEYQLNDEMKIPFVDLSGYNSDGKIDIIQRIKSNMNSESLSKVLYRVLIIKLGVDSYKVLWYVHHAIFDGYSANVLKRTIEEYYDNYRFNNVNTLLEFRDYNDYVNDTMNTINNIDTKKIVEIYDLDNYKDCVLESNKIISKKLSGDISDLLTFEFAIPEQHVRKFNEEVWEISFQLFTKLCTDYFRINKIPVLIYVYGRNKVNYYDSIGEYIDLIPVIAKENYSISEMLQHKMAASSENNISFANFVLDKEKGNNIKDYILGSDNEGNASLLMFNFQGYKSEEEYKLYKQAFTEEMSMLSDTNQMSDSFGFDAITFNVTYSNNRIMVAINGLKTDDKKIIEEMLYEKLEESII